MKLSYNAINILKERYLIKDENGDVQEDPLSLFKRVAKEIAEVEKKYNKNDEYIKNLEQSFLSMMSNLEFLPNSPTLMNAGTSLNQLSACFVIPIEDSMESIFQAVKDASIIHKSGGGTGYSFSRLRPKDDIVKSTGGIASGPISFMTVFDAATNVIKQGGRRRGANMAILRVDHPDILDFIVAKEREGNLSNFNLSVAITDKFMKAVLNDKDYDIVNPRNKRVTKRLKARAVWNLLITMAWKNGEPGVVFIDRINKFNPTPSIGEIESTNPCAEQPLLPYESCNLGSINLNKMVEGNRISWIKLREIVHLSVRFLDNVIDANSYPLEIIGEQTRGNRKIGLGVMGFADMLIKLDIPYNSDKAINLAKKIMKFINDEARNISEQIGKEKGSFPNFDKSALKNKYKTMRNATVTTIAPTGSISIIANCSSGIEPLFSLVYVRKLSESIGKDLIEINSLFKNKLEEKELYSTELINKISSKTSIQGENLPVDIKELFITAHDISPEEHIKIQAAFQQYTDNAVSKTVNFPKTATINDIENTFLLAYNLGCKGVTVYRDKSRKLQVLDRIDSKTCEGGICPICS